MTDADKPVSEESKSAGDGMDIPLSDSPLLDLLDALVNERARVAAEEGLDVNYRTMVAAYESRGAEAARTAPPQAGLVPSQRGALSIQSVLTTTITPTQIQSNVPWVALARSLNLIAVHLDSGKSGRRYCALTVYGGDGWNAPGFHSWAGDAET